MKVLFRNICSICIVSLISLAVLYGMALMCEPGSEWLICDVMNVCSEGDWRD